MNDEKFNLLGKWLAISLIVIVFLLIVLQCTTTINIAKNNTSSPFHVEQYSNNSADSASVNPNIDVR